MNIWRLEPVAGKNSWRPEPARGDGQARLSQSTWTRRITLGSNQGRLEIAAEGGADHRSAKNAATPMNQPREAHHAAWPLHSPEGGQSHFR